MSNPPLPVIYISDRRTLYLGRSHLPLREIHSGATWLLICLEGNVRFRANNDDHWASAKSMLIPAGTKIMIDNKDAVLSVCYLDACQPDFQAIKSFMQSINSGVYFNYKYEESFIASLLQLRDEQPRFDEVQDRLQEILYAPHANSATELKVDPRIQHVVTRLKETSAENVSVKDLAKEVEMSESGLIKLFRKQVGAPIRKHRLWYRLMNFVTYMMTGMSTAEAIPLAGFSDASHLSKCYSSLMGIPVSIAFAQPPRIECIVCDKALAKARLIQATSSKLAG
jgi:AraC-like DNA-binding protein